ncbi:hypothetical protein QTP88_006668 [Uroleucon formosanum]
MILPYANNPSLGVISLILCGHLISTISLSPTNPSGELAKKLYSASTNRPAESLSHVVNHCMRYTSLYMAWHNSLVARLKKAAAGRFEIVSENQAIGTQRLRPDLVIRRGTATLIIDATVPFNNRRKAFEEAAQIKKDKYDDLRKELAADHPGEVTVYPFIVGSLGSWEPANDFNFVCTTCKSLYS